MLPQLYDTLHFDRMASITNQRPSKPPNQKLQARLELAEEISRSVFSKIGFTKDAWVQRQNILMAKGLLEEKQEELTKRLPKYIVGHYYKNDGGPTFRTIMTLLRNLARYAEVAIIRRKVQQKVAGKWKTTYYYKLCT
jgi:hypothetical protein